MNSTNSVNRSSGSGNVVGELAVRVGWEETWVRRPSRRRRRLSEAWSPRLDEGLEFALVEVEASSPVSCSLRRLPVLFLGVRRREDGVRVRVRERFEGVVLVRVL